MRYNIQTPDGADITLNRREFTSLESSYIIIDGNAIIWKTYTELSNKSLVMTLNGWKTT